MKAKFSTIVRGASLLAALTALTVRGSDKAVAADAFPTFESYIKVTGQAPSINGDESAYQRRMQQSKSGGIGIEDLHYIKESKETTTEINGRALTGSEDYLGQIKLTKNEFGSADFGYKSFRTFYDGIGGFFPLNGNWQPLANRDLHLDRSKLWAEATLALPNAPVFTLRYANEKREGQKDSTIWGDTDFTGLPNNNPPISQVRKIVPSYIDLDEETESLEFIAKHTIGNTTLQLTLLGEQIKNFDTRFVTRFPGEVKPFPSPVSTLLMPAAQMNNQAKIVQGDGIDSKATISTFTTETKFNDQLTLKCGLIYELVHADLSGYRSLDTQTPTATGVVPINTFNYQGLVGGSRILSYAGNTSLTYAPSKDWSLNFAVKRQEEYLRSDVVFNAVAASGTPATTLATTPRSGWSHGMEKITTPEVGVRYTGFRDVTIYANYSKASVTGQEKNTSAFNPLTAISGTNALNNISEAHGNYTVGANWKPSTFLTTRVEMFQKSHQNGYVGYGARAADFYNLDYNFTGWKVTSVVKPTDMITSTTRYIYQSGQTSVTGYLPAFPEYPAGNTINHTISETIDWNPNQQFYAQANVNFVFNNMSTVYPRAGRVAATVTNISWDANKVLQDAKNDYVTMTLLCGTTLSAADDLQIQFNYYKADNSDVALAAWTVPYGMMVEETSVTVGLKHKFSDRVVGDAKVGYFDSASDTTGGLTNFHGPQAYVSLTYAL